MALSFNCSSSWCSKSEIEKPGALIFGPAGEKTGKSAKLHVCRQCFGELRRRLSCLPEPAGNRTTDVYGPPSSRGSCLHFRFGPDALGQIRRMLERPRKIV